MEDGIWLLLIIVRLLDMASHRIKLNIIRAVSEIIAPIDEIEFHVVYVSG